MEDQCLVYTLDEGLASVGFGKFQKLVMCFAGLGLCAEAMEIMILSFIGPVVKSEWDLSSNEESLLTTVVFAGMLAGTYSWGLISDIYGRRKGFLGMAVLATAASILSSFAQNYISLLVFRCLVGFGLGSGPVFFSWFLEFLPASNRGTWMVVFSTFWTLGTIAEASLAWIVMPRLNWRWLLALSSIPSAALLIFYCLIPESPRYLLLIGQRTDAQQILEKIAFYNGTQLPAGMIISDSSPSQGEGVAPTEETPLLSSSENKFMEFKSGFSSFFMLFSSKLARTTIILWVLFFANSFSYYGIILLTSKLSSGDDKCESGILKLGDTQSESGILKLADTQSSSLYIDMFITTLAELPGLALSALLVDRIGRRLSLEAMYILACILLLPLVSHQSDILRTFLLFGSRMCTNAAFTIACIYAPELYPTSVRATGAGVANAMGRIGGMVCPLVAVGLVSGCQQTAAVILFELVILVSAVFTLLIPFETKGRELSDTVSASD